jgi:hypothetical protein
MGDYVKKEENDAKKSFAVFNGVLALFSSQSVI